MKILAFLTIAALTISCSGNGDNTTSVKTDTLSLKVPYKEMLVGNIGVCSSSDNLELIKPDSSIVNIDIWNERFFGERDLGDPVEVTFIIVDGHPISSTIVNLRTLQKTWKHVNDSTDVRTFLAMQENHHAHIFNNVGRDEYCDWHLDDGLIILSVKADSLNTLRTDTLSILSLNSDTLRLVDREKKLTFVKAKT